MKPIDFKEANFTFEKPSSMTEEECEDLRCYKGDGQVISCWKLSFSERIKVLFTGKVWLGVLGTIFFPTWLDVKTPFIKKKK